MCLLCHRVLDSTQHIVIVKVTERHECLMIEMNHKALLEWSIEKELWKYSILFFLRAQQFKSYSCQIMA